MWLAGAQSIAYFAGKSSPFTFAAAQADSVSTCLLQASTSVDPTVQVSHSHCTCDSLAPSQATLAIISETLCFMEHPASMQYLLLGTTHTLAIRPSIAGVLHDSCYIPRVTSASQQTSPETTDGSVSLARCATGAHSVTQMTCTVQSAVAAAAVADVLAYHM